MVENSQLKQQIDRIENKLMSSNVILHGISDQQWELSAITREKALSALSHIANGKTSKDKMDIVRKIGFRDIRCLGEYREHRNHPILLEFEKRVSAEFLLENRKLLPRGVFVDREYSEEFECERRLLRPILKKAKSLCEYKMKSKLEGGKLIIQGKSKTVHLLPKPLTGYSVTSKESDSHIGFFGELNPFSNFHPAPFTHEGITFHSSEQWIQYQKAKLFSDEHTAQKILESDTALKCQRLSREIANFDHITWCDRARIVCEPGIQQKFTQNPMLMNLLKATGSKMLVECTYDHLWGSGLLMYEDQPFEEARWSSDNLLGNILMSIRSTNSTIPGNNEEESMIK